MNVLAAVFFGLCSTVDPIDTHLHMAGSKASQQLITPLLSEDAAEGEVDYNRDEDCRDCRTIESRLFRLQSASSVSRGVGEDVFSSSTTTTANGRWEEEEEEGGIDAHLVELTSSRRCEVTQPEAGTARQLRGSGAAVGAVGAVGGA
jgi:hypothetical protein